jgi:hypothetical protein
MIDLATHIERVGIGEAPLVAIGRTVEQRALFAVTNSIALIT